MWAYVLILIIGVAVTIVGIRIGQRRHDRPADVTSGGDASRPEPFSSLREPAPPGTGDDTGTAPVEGKRAPRVTLEKRLRDARETRAAKRGAAAAAATVADVSTAASPGDAATTAVAVSSAATAPEEPVTPPSAGEPAPASTGDAPTEAVEAVVASEPVPVAASEPVEEPEPAAPTEPVVPAPTRIEIRDLAAGQREDFAQRWTPLRMRLLARPSGAIADADGYVRELLEARGLPSDPDDPAMVEASNAYPDIVDPFRLATAIARREAEGTADPQQVRLATVHYRDAVDRLLAVDDTIVD